VLVRASWVDSSNPSNARDKDAAFRGGVTCLFDTQRYMIKISYTIHIICIFSYDDKYIIDDLQQIPVRRRVSESIRWSRHATSDTRVTGREPWLLSANWASCQPPRDITGAVWARVYGKGAEREKLEIKGFRLEGGRNEGGGKDARGERKSRGTCLNGTQVQGFKGQENGGKPARLWRKMSAK